ncbi:MAG TPA: zinc-dependent alcohol dehydrogenase family protein [Gammaproteobacteria bacterium]|nr:zinc-dependent alcohol dehydrogenase family protein [Gammaproteobacteria bacterium]
MKAMILDEVGGPLRLTERPVPTPGPGQVLLKVSACAVCRTDLHVIDGELPDVPYPVIPGHEIVGTVVSAGSGAHWSSGTRLGVPWLGYTCGHCLYCDRGQENLCDSARFTGYQIDGGFAEYVAADGRYCFELDSGYDDVHAAPLLCAGLIGYRALKMAGDARKIGIYGFGAAAHIIAQVAAYQCHEIYAFTRPGDSQAQVFARRLGALWAGNSGESPGVELDAAIIFAPVGALVPQALRSVRKGGTVVCAGIHMSDIPTFPYNILWGEREIRSVANLTRRDAKEFLALAPHVPVGTEIERFRLEEANVAVDRLRKGELSGAAVLTMQ